MAQTQAAPEVNLGDVLRQVAREKEIDYERWVQALEDAMASAAKKQHRIKEPVRAHWNPESGKFEAYIVKKVVETVEDAGGNHVLDRLRGQQRRDAPRHRHAVEVDRGQEARPDIPYPGLGLLEIRRQADDRPRLRAVRSHGASPNR